MSLPCRRQCYGLPDCCEVEHLLQNDQPLVPAPSGFGFGLNPLPVKLTSVGTKLLVAATEKGFFRRMVNEDSWMPITSTVIEHSDEVESENNSQDKQGLKPSFKQHSSYDLHVESFASIRHSLYMSGSIGEKSGTFGQMMGVPHGCSSLQKK